MTMAFIADIPLFSLHPDIAKGTQKHKHHNIKAAGYSSTARSSAS